MVALCTAGWLGRFQMTITPFAGVAFWLIVIGFVAVNIVLQKIHGTFWSRNVVMFSVSAFVVFCTLKQSTVLVAILFVVSVVVYCVGTYVISSPRKKESVRLITWVIACVILFLCYFKYAVIQIYLNRLVDFCLSTFTGNPLQFEQHLYFVGVSYFTFKFIHFLVESYRGKITTGSVLVFLNYIFFFPNFFSGPINRYNTFADSLLADDNISENILEGGKRIITGLFKKIVLGDFLFPYTIATIDLSTTSIIQIILGIYAYGFYIYFNFSGYSDMAIGCGRMVGIILPENFNFPFIRRNLQQFWANWHMSLTSWLTDYVYWPLAKKNRHIQWFRKKPVTLSNVCIVFTFIICGVWHGDGLNFFLWGVYHGLGLSILNSYTYLIKKHGTRSVKRFVKKSPVAYGISNFITFQYVSFGFLIFACDMERLKVVSAIFLK